MNAKLPSDTTIYQPASKLRTPPSNIEHAGEKIINQISDFIAGIRMQAEPVDNGRANSRVEGACHSLDMNTGVNDAETMEAQKHAERTGGG